MINALLNGNLSTSFRVRNVNRKVICDICESLYEKNKMQTEFTSTVRFLMLVDFNKRNAQVLEMRASIRKVKLKHTKAKIILEQTMKTQVERRGLYVLFL